jgi:5-methyltetrahydrofolate--homocysteine methyltransferase
MTRLAGSRSTVEFGPGRPLLLINDQLRIYDQDAEVLRQLKRGNFAPLVQLALEGDEHGCQMVDILLDHFELDEAELLPQVVNAIDQALGCPLSIDSRNPAAIDRALENYTGKALLNSITYEAEVLDLLIPLVTKYNMAVVAMLVDDVRIPETWQERLFLAKKIVQITDAAGISRDDVVFDCVCLAAAAVPNSMQVTLDTLKAVHEELGMSTLLGIGNAGFGMPFQTRLDMLYLAIGVSWGLDAALVDYRTENLVYYARGADFLTGRDLYGQSYIELYRDAGICEPRRNSRRGPARRS